MKRIRIGRAARFLNGIALAAIALLPTVSQAGDPVYVGATPKRTVAMSAIGHNDWDALLKKYVDQEGRVDYAGWQASGADRAKLQRYLRQLSTASLAGSADASVRLAYWINAYNAVTVEGILREYPTTSIRNHTAKLFGYNIWKDLKLRVDQTAISLDDIEHKVLRKMGEPRIHFAIVCASIGCPRLLNEAYTAKRIDEQLETNAKDFFSRRQNFQFDAARSAFSLSAILDWFGDDFGSSQGKVLKRIAPWLPSESAKRVAATGKGRVSYLSYDWNLNTQ